MKRAAVTYRFDSKVTPYADALRMVGIEPVLVTPDRPLASLDEVHGLVLTGGRDLNPRLYGQDRYPHTEDPDDRRDALEVRLLRDALDRDMPVLAICRGMQLFNVVHSGGTLVQHIDGHAVRGNDLSEPVHAVSATPGTALAGILGSGEIPVNSRQSPGRARGRLRAAARCARSGWHHRGGGAARPPVRRRSAVAS